MTYKCRQCNSTSNEDQNCPICGIPMNELKMQDPGQDVNPEPATPATDQPADAPTEEATPEVAPTEEAPAPVTPVEEPAPEAAPAGDGDQAEEPQTPSL